MNNSSNQIYDDNIELVIKASTSTPFVLLNPNGQLTITGRSIPVDGSLFFLPVFEWLENYIKNPCFRTVLSVELEYMNDITSKYLVRIITDLRKACDQFTVKWKYDAVDEDMLELGQLICASSGSEFEYIMLK